MARHEAAWAEAERLIAQARSTGATELSLAGLRIKALPPSLAALAPQLRGLDLSGCWALEDLRGLEACGGLQTLALARCGKLRDFRVLAGLSGLQSLNLRGCGVGELSVLAGLSGLQSLDLSERWGVSELSALAGLSGLQSLDLSGCDGVSELSVLAGLSGLQSLDLSGCAGVSELSALAGLSGLQSLDLSGCDGVRELNALAGLSGLQSLALSGCSGVSELSALAGLSGLQSLNLSGCFRVSELSALAGLRGLRSLDLSWCLRVRELSALAGLSGLRSLNLSKCDGVSELSALAGLRGLRSLDLSWCRGVSELSALAGLSGLQSLNLSECAGVSELSALAGLSGLQSLNLSECTGVSELSALAGLSGLQSLNLSGCTGVSELSALAGLSELQSLNLSGCPGVGELSALAGLSGLQSLNLSGCTGVSELSALAGLSGLQSLNLSGCPGVGELSALAGLRGLQSLYLSRCAGVSELSALAGLSGLQSLNLSWCVGVHDLSPLLGLQNLRRLDAYGVNCQAPTPIQLWQAWPYLNHLELGNLRGTPPELLPSGSAFQPFDDWCQALLDHGSLPQPDAKLFVLGNGRIGKTQITRRLCGQAFDPSVPSTHGVALQHFELLPASAQNPSATTARVWDFGGQDLYLSTHRLFLDERAVYLLLWTPATETEDPVLDHGIWLPQHRLDYWLDYLQASVGQQAPLVLAQAQCDAALQEQAPPLPCPHGFDWLRPTTCSAQSEEGLERLLPDLRTATRRLQETHGVAQMPRNWLALADALRQRPERVLPLAEFHALCAQHQVTAPGTLLGYLHQSGQVFWKADVFSGDVVLDQAWALDGIYALLHREKVLPALHRQRGRFSREDLGERLWDAVPYTLQEQEHFISLMCACRICFQVAKGQYLLPDCLPERLTQAPLEQAVWRSAQADAAASLRYGFMHGGIQRGLLCAIGERAGANAVYWRYGVCFYDTEAQASVRLHCQTAPAPQRSGSVELEVSGPNAAGYLAELVDSIERGIQMGQKPVLHWLRGGHSAAPVAGHAAAERAAAPSTQREPAEPFAQISAAPLPPPVKPAVYVSYAWGGESEQTVEDLMLALAPYVDVRQDRRSMQPGDSIRAFEQEIGRGACVLVVLSAKYMRSVDCMRELSFLWERAQREPQAFKECVIPVVLGDVAIDTPHDRLKHVEYWRDQETSLIQLMNKIGPKGYGQSTSRDLQDICAIQAMLDDALACLKDPAMPRGHATLQACDYGPVLDLLCRRLGLPR